jgi:hypothetical protein
MDLTGIEGLTEAQITAIQVMHDTDVTGLKGKNSELLGKMDDYKTDAQKNADSIEEARLTAVTAKEAQLVAEGKYEEANALRETERATLVAQANTDKELAQNMLKQRDLKDVHFDILQKVGENLQAPAQAMLNAMTDISYGENGETQVSIKCGDKEFNNTADFLTHAETDATWKAMLKAPNTQGINVHSSNGQAGGNYEKADMSGTKAQKVAAAVQANPKLKDLPLR